MRIESTGVPSKVMTQIREFCKPRRITQEHKDASAVLTKKAIIQHQQRKADNHRRAGDSAMEGARYIAAKAKGRLWFSGDNISPVKVMSNLDRRRMGIEQDESIEDYQPLVEVEK